MIRDLWDDGWSGRLALAFFAACGAVVILGFVAIVYMLALAEPHTGTVRRAHDSTTYTKIGNQLVPSTTCKITLADGWTCQASGDCEVERGDVERFATCWPPDEGAL